MVVKKHVYILLSILFLSGAVPSSGNQRNQPQAKNSDEKPSVTIGQIELAVRSSDIQLISKYFLRPVFISLRGAESGYFSANQASLLLHSFFESRRVVRFTFTTISETEEPFATGGGVMIEDKGSRQSFQIYVALLKVDNRWVISQFNVY